MSGHNPEVLHCHGFYGADAHLSTCVAGTWPLLPSRLARLASERAEATIAAWDPTFQPGSGTFEVAVSRLRPRVVLLFAHPQLRREALWMVPVARRCGAAVVICGPDAHLAPEPYLRAGADAALHTDDGAPWLELLRALRATGYRGDAGAIGHIPGLHTLDASGSPRRSADPPGPHEALPAALHDPTTTRIHLERQGELRGVRVMPLATSQGCPSPCLGCSHRHQSSRRRAPDDVGAEVRLLRETYRWDRLGYQDEVFAHDEGWLADFAAALGSTPPPCEVTVRPGLLDARHSRRLMALQCVLASVDAQSGSPAVLDRLGAPFGPKEVYRACGLLRDAGIPVQLRVVLGGPGETRAELDESLALIDHVRPASVECFRPGRVRVPRCWTRHWGWSDDGTPWEPPQVSDAALDAAEAWIGRLNRPSPTGARRWLESARNAALRTFAAGRPTG